MIEEDEKVELSDLILSEMSLFSSAMNFVSASTVHLLSAQWSVTVTTIMSEVIHLLDAEWEEAAASIASCAEDTQAGEELGSTLCLLNFGQGSCGTHWAENMSRLLSMLQVLQSFHVILCL